MSGRRVSEQFRLDGKNAIVTGGAGLLGRRFCHGLAEFGAHVACVDLDGASSARIARECASEYGVRALGIACDVSKPEEVRRMVRRVVTTFGSIDILHNNAATHTRDRKAFYRRFEDYDFKKWREVMAVNIDGMFLVAQAVGKEMLRQGRGGTIIQTASIYGLWGADHRIYENQPMRAPAVYAASKGAVIALTRYLATYWAGKGIRVNTLIPGGVEDGQKRSFVQRYSDRIPLGRMARPDEMVAALIYLASDASSYVTGESLCVDGGLGAW